jgi:uncharacterized protein YjbI with pentapeptide repeats
MKFCDLSHARLDLCDLREADLESACLHRATRDGADLGGARTRNMEGTDPERERAESFKAG